MIQEVITPSDVTEHRADILLLVVTTIKYKVIINHSPTKIPSLFTIELRATKTVHIDTNSFVNQKIKIMTDRQSFYSVTFISQSRMCVTTHTYLHVKYLLSMTYGCC